MEQNNSITNANDSTNHNTSDDPDQEDTVEPSSSSSSICLKPNLRLIFNERTKLVMESLINSRKAHDELLPNNSKSTIFVKNIPWDVTESILKKFFSKFGHVTKTRIIRKFGKVPYGGSHPYENIISAGCGWVKFSNENETGKALSANPNQLLLMNRKLEISSYKRPKNKNKRITITYSNLDEEQSLINKLPIDILVSILASLCVRDLCIAERVCKRWFDTTKIVWSTKKELVFTPDAVFQNYKPPKDNNPYGFNINPKFNEHSLNQILRKNFGPNLKHLDTSGYAKYFDKNLTKLFMQKCSNLISLNLSNMTDISNLCARSIGTLENLRILNLAYCHKMTDTTIGKIFKHCVNLESIDLSSTMITGKCFLKAPQSLKSLIIDACQNLEEEYFYSLLDRNRCLENLSMNSLNIYYEKSITAKALLFMLNTQLSLKSLSLSGHSLSSLYHNSLEKINFQRLENFCSLNLSYSVGNIELLRKLLSSSKSLKILELSYATSLDDQIFDLSAITCPLIEINLSFIDKLTDATLKNICKLLRTLKTLKLKGCTKLTNECIIDAMIQLSNLETLDVRNNRNVDNSLLTAAMNLENDRSISIICIDTNVNTIEFEFKYPEVTKKYIDFNHYTFEYKNLRFDTGLTVRVPNASNQEIWKNDDMIYIGAPLGSEDEWDNFEFDNDDYYGYDDLNGGDDDYFEDENENEMINELDEF